MSSQALRPVSPPMYAPARAAISRDRGGNGRSCRVQPLSGRLMSQSRILAAACQSSPDGSLHAPYTCRCLVRSAAPPHPVPPSASSAPVVHQRKPRGMTGQHTHAAARFMHAHSVRTQPGSTVLILGCGDGMPPRVSRQTPKWPEPQKMAQAPVWHQASPRSAGTPLGQNHPTEYSGRRRCRLPPGTKPQIAKFIAIDILRHLRRWPVLNIPSVVEVNNFLERLEDAVVHVGFWKIVARPFVHVPQRRDFLFAVVLIREFR